MCPTFVGGILSKQTNWQKRAKKQGHKLVPPPSDRGTDQVLWPILAPHQWPSDHGLGHTPGEDGDKRAILLDKGSTMNRLADEGKLAKKLQNANFSNFLLYFKPPCRER